MDAGDPLEHLDLRAIFYMDEIFGYLLPTMTAVEPSRCLLTLPTGARVQARLCVLATQNRRKWISTTRGCQNRGHGLSVLTLQTERDKMRGDRPVLESALSNVAWRGRPPATLG